MHAFIGTEELPLSAPSLLPQTIYSFGYAGTRPEQLLVWLKQKNAIAVDTRFSANSQDPNWRKKHLQALLGDRYLHVQEFGNKNYRSDGPIEFVNLNAGIERLRPLLLKQPLLLFCMCWNWSQCHRTAAARALADSTGSSVKVVARSELPKVTTEDGKTFTQGNFFE